MNGFNGFKRLFKRHNQYLSLQVHDEDSKTGGDSETPVKRSTSYRIILCLLFLCFVVTVIFGFNGLTVRLSKEAELICDEPLRRNEWRSLRAIEQEQYIRAVQCLMQKDSMFEPGSSRYDDFSYAHVLEGANVHYAAAFLPWHRHFIHTFEKALRSECSYKGTLTYWDWTLDTSDLAASSIWQSILGFGSNGTPASGNDPIDGNCVLDGPFANTTRHWQSKANDHGFDIMQTQHCLSRGFETGATKEELQAQVSPRTVDKILSTDSYESFFDQLETLTHNAIPQFIGGDFSELTAPNDPVFYLHHTQVDRLWWMWQQRDPVSRTYQYQGPAGNVRISKEGPSNTSAGLEDILSLGVVGEPVRVKDVMNTQSKMLCYRY